MFQAAYTCNIVLKRSFHNDYDVLFGVSINEVKWIVRSTIKLLEGAPQEEILKLTNDTLLEPTTKFE